MSNQQRFVRTSKGIIDINEISFIREDKTRNEIDFFMKGEDSYSMSLDKPEAEMFMRLYIPIVGDTTKP